MFFYTFFLLLRITVCIFKEYVYNGFDIMVPGGKFTLKAVKIIYMYIKLRNNAIKNVTDNRTSLVLQ